MQTLYLHCSLNMESWQVFPKRRRRSNDEYSGYQRGQFLFEVSAAVLFFILLGFFCIYVFFVLPFYICFLMIYIESNIELL